MTGQLVYLNGEYLPTEQAQVSVMDRGFLFGDGVYEVIPAYGGHPFRLLAHLNRLENSLLAIGMAPVMDHATWRDIFTRLLAQGDGGDQQVYLQVTRGAYAKRDHNLPAEVHPTVFAMASPLTPRKPELIEHGIGAVFVDDIRWRRCDIKAITLLANVMARQEANARGADDAILVRDGLANEGAASNLFIVRDGQVSTPPNSECLLPGITRDMLLELLLENRIPVTEAELSPDDVRAADEVWLTSSTREIVAVTRLDGQSVGDGRPGPLWRRVDQLFAELKTRLRKGAAQ